MLKIFLFFPNLISTHHSGHFANSDTSNGVSVQVDKHKVP